MMGLQAKISVLCIINVIWVQHILCDGQLQTSVSNWTCTCSTRQENLNSVPLDCYSSCVCNPALGGKSDRWTCICPVNGLPKVAHETTDRSCFISCNCNAGTLTELEPLKKRIFGEVVVIVLLSCLILIVLSFIAFLMWYSCRNNMYSVFWPSFSSDGLDSSTSGTNLASLGSSSISAGKGHSGSPVKSYSIGCIPKKSFRFRSKPGALHGTIIQFSYSELETATNRFSQSNLIGVGGSSHVYHGNLRDGRIVAIKRMKTQGGPDAERVFLSEIELISRLHHCHVVPLLGYCLAYQGKNAERLLVFEYIPKGNLRECLDGNPDQCLDWSTRVSIALGAARGLEYLHDAAAPRILHRDVKSTNILLDENWRAKITDLGMATHLQNDGALSCSSSPDHMQGTFGYFAPEYAIIGRASLKSDVFSFGVVLLELITGRKPIQKTSKGEESLVIWATPRLHDSKRVILELPDPQLKGDFQEEEMQVMAYLAKECLLLDPEARPTMREVVQVLSTIAPDRSRRSNIPGHASQYSCTSGLRSKNPEADDEQYSDTSAPEEIKQITCEVAAGGSAKSPGTNFCAIENRKKEAQKASNDVEKLMLLTRSSRSWHLQDEERVDITEPRMEMFCLPNVDSHIVQVT